MCLSRAGIESGGSLDHQSASANRPLYCWPICAWCGQNKCCGISGIDPINVGSGDTLTMKGANLTGWRAAVSIGDTTLDATVTTDDAATVTIPAHLGAGIYDLQIDIPPVFRRQFTIEIGP